MPRLADSPDYTLTLHQADQTRSDFAAIESELQLVMSQVAQLPTRAYVCRILLLTTASLWALVGAVAFWLK